MKLVLFFTSGMSFELWEKTGNLSREIKPYIELAKTIEHIYFVTYGHADREQFKKVLPANCTILDNRWRLPAKVFSLLAPWLYAKDLRDADAYKTNQMSGAWLPLIARRLYGKKLIVRCGYELLFFLEKQKVIWLKRTFTSWLEKWAYTAADRIILTSHHDKALVAKRFAIPSEKIIVNPNYIDTAVFRPLPVAKESNELIFVGRLAEQKNLFSLFSAIAKTPYRLTCVGSGPLEAKLRDHAALVQANVTFLGNIPNDQLPPLINRAAAFVLPSFYEGSPKTLLEAMACGALCIATKVVGNEEVINSGSDGYLVGTDVDSLAKGIMEVMQPTEKNKQIAATARRTIEDHFSLAGAIKRELTCYHDLGLL